MYAARATRFARVVAARPAVFGATAHRWHVQPPLGADELAKLEATVGMLPDAYRWWIRQVSAGGAGPGYGLLPRGYDADNPDLSAAGERDWLLLADRGGGRWSVLQLADGCVHTLVIAPGEEVEFVEESPDFACWLDTWLGDCEAHRPSA